MKKEIDFLLFEIKKRDSNDYAKELLDRILGIVLLSDKNFALDYIKTINDKDTYWIISNHFPYFSFKYQDIEFIKIIIEKTKQFENKVENFYYERFHENLQESINALHDDIIMEFKKIQQ